MSTWSRLSILLRLTKSQDLRVQLGGDLDPNNCANAVYTSCAQTANKRRNDCLESSSLCVRRLKFLQCPSDGRLKKTKEKQAETVNLTRIRCWGWGAFRCASFNAHLPTIVAHQIIKRDFYCLVNVRAVCCNWCRNECQSQRKEDGNILCLLFCFFFFFNNKFDCQCH